MDSIKRLHQEVADYISDKLKYILSFFKKDTLLAEEEPYLFQQPKDVTPKSKASTRKPAKSKAKAKKTNA